MRRLPRWRRSAPGGLPRRSEGPHTARARTRVAAGGSGCCACSVQVVPEDLRAAGVAQLRHGLRLDLADPLTRDAVDLADLVEGARLAVGQAEAQPDDAGLPLRQGLQHAGELVLHEREAD